mgnify:CR=1 FL=1
MEENWFKDWFDTDYYHLLYKERDEVEAAKAYNKKAIELHGEFANINIIPQ